MTYLSAGDNRQNDTSDNDINDHEIEYQNVYFDVFELVKCGQYLVDVEELIQAKRCSSCSLIQNHKRH